MKKVLALCVALLMVAVLAVPALAAPGAFVSSPSGNAAPTLDSAVSDSEECTAQVIITAYADRATLSAEDRAALEEAYNEIVHHTSDNPFKTILSQLAQKLSCKVTQLSVSDLFDIDTTNCATHDGHGGFTITLKVSNAAQLVGILHFNGTAWEIADMQSVDEEKNTVTFHATDFSPFALVVDNGTGAPIGGVDEPAPNNTWWIVLIIVLIVLIAGAVVAYVIYKKNKKEAAAA